MPKPCARVGRSARTAAAAAAPPAPPAPGAPRRSPPARAPKPQGPLQGLGFQDVMQRWCAGSTPLSCIWIHSSRHVGGCGPGATTLCCCHRLHRHAACCCSAIAALPWQNDAAHAGTHLLRCRCLLLHQQRLRTPCLPAAAAPAARIPRVQNLARLLTGPHAASTTICEILTYCCVFDLCHTGPVFHYTRGFERPCINTVSLSHSMLLLRPQHLESNSAALLQGRTHQAGDGCGRQRHQSRGHFVQRVPCAAVGRAAWHSAQSGDMSSTAVHMHIWRPSAPKSL